MNKIEAGTPLVAVEIEHLTPWLNRVLLRKNFAEETRTDDAGNEQTVYTADEAVLITREMGLTVEQVEENFDEYLVQALTGKTTAEFYADEVDALVRVKYSQSAVEAILNNYLANQKDSEAKAEFEALQAYRTECKQIATEKLHALCGDA